MTDLRKAMEDYLSVRRALGYKLKQDGALLSDFVDYVKTQGSAFITTDLALQWARLPADAAACWWARRLGAVRGFAKHLHGLDSRTEVPAADLIPYRKPRATPYMYTHADIRALMQACEQIRGRLLPVTYSTLIGLLATTGMRVGEAIMLNRTDVSIREHLLVVRHGKFGKSREVPLHSTTVEALRFYAHKRDRVLRAKSTNFFLSRVGTPLIYNSVHRIFLRLVEQVGLADRLPRRPRIHDLRHTFAVNTLLRWYRDGADVQARIAVLSTYLGHVNPSSTYWYLSAAPELMGLAAERLESSLGDLP